MKNAILPSFLLILTLAGAGCSASKTAETSPTSTASPTVTTPTKNTPTNGNTQPITETPTTTPVAVNSTPEPTVNTPSSVQPSPIDDTWKTYTSRDGSFSFQYPTKGKFAPLWEQMFVKSENVPTSNCKTYSISVDMNVCQVTTMEGTNRIDDLYFPYTEKMYVRVRLTKSNLKDEAGYQVQVEQIAGTYQVKK